MKYEGTMQVVGFVNVELDEPGLSLEDAKKKAEANPEKYQVGTVESLKHEAWEQDLECTEHDDPHED